MTTSSPLIGITTYGRNQENRFTLPAEYVDGVRRAGGIPLLIPPGEAQFEKLFPHLDGLILTGGGDLAPELYGGQPHETIYSIDPERDQSELVMTRRVLETHLPTLGICRGLQVINVALGGTLIEHLPDVVGDRVAHKELPHGPIPHVVEIQAGSHLAEIVQATQVETASWHHQALRQVAPQLKVVAYAPDGTVEGVEMPKHRWLVAVQWHPELTASDDPSQQRLFDALVQAARRQKL
ncbi:MAG TPA: gamma-glutamyl-gamma-aminobutyrate hydrolase family protein [Anaerolineae bacterium]|nr:gamma-glutamyl-gamma-aminobutyrate hydrolase family protein [Anaerolineae bacterium]